MLITEETITFVANFVTGVHLVKAYLNGFE